MHQAAGELVELARQRAADVLEADAGRPRGRPERPALRGARRTRTPAVTLGRAGRDASRCWCATRVRPRPAPTFPFGAHVAVVEVDIETGKAELRAAGRRRRRRARCSTRCSPRASGTAASPRASAQALLEEVALRRRRQPADRDASPTTPFVVGDRAAQLRAGRHGDADHLQPAGRQGDRRGRARSAPPRRCRTRSSTRSRTSASGTSTCPPRRMRVWQAIQRAAPARGGELMKVYDHRQRRAADRRRRAAAAAGALPARRRAGCTATNIGCDTTSCGACTVLVDGESVKSARCSPRRPTARAVTTLEGLAGPDGELHPVQAAFRAEHGLQCGFCTPGMVMAAVGLLAENPRPHRARGPRGPGGQPLPLHRLPQHRAGGPRRGPAGRRPAGRGQGCGA